VELRRALSHSSLTKSVAVLVVPLLCFSEQNAFAQTTVGKEFSSQRLDLPTGPRNFITTRGARQDGQMAWNAGLGLSYANTLIKVTTCISPTPGDCANGLQTRELKVVENLAQADLMYSLTPIPRLQIGLRLPVAYITGNGIELEDNGNLKKINNFGLGDPELEAKFRFLGEAKDPIVAGVALYGTAPLGHLTAEGAYLGDETPGGGIRAILDGDFGIFVYGVNVGGIVRGTGRMDQTEVGSEFRYSAAVGVRPSPLIRVLIDAFGSTRFTAQPGENALEIDGGAQLTPIASPLAFNAAGVFGAIQGFGAPAFRAILGFNYNFEKRDRDEDGIDDSVDQCPTEAEDRDNYEDSDGCPDPDNDLDTIPDASDKCPNQAEDQDGFEDNDGCPDLDNDKDGIPDTGDRCPTEPETKNGFDDTDGCPDQADRDRDGVPDDKDKCPDEAEDTDGFEDTDGCPDPDNDKDGVPDDQDECVDEPETVNKFEDEDGCPDDPKQKTKKAPKAPKAAPAEPQPETGKVLEL
jgi:hypothetical protein